MARSERGMNDSVQWAILTPLLLFLILGALQVGLWAHGRSIASSAAIAGAEAGARLEASPGTAQAVAHEVAERGGLRNVQVTVAKDASQVRVVVAGNTANIVDLGRPTVSYQATRPVERVTRP